MQRVLKSLLAFLVAAAFGVASIAIGTASPYAEHPGQMLHGAAGTGLTVGCKPAAREFAQHPASQHEHEQCLHPCCVSTTAAALPGVVTPYAVVRIESDAFPISGGKVLTGIAIAPPTGPPKLSA
jgi:hypothetical protein